MQKREGNEGEAQETTEQKNQHERRNKTEKTKGDKGKGFEVTGFLQLLQNDKTEVSIISSCVRWPHLSTTMGAVYTGRLN
jgi:hypothetical protein